MVDQFMQNPLFKKLQEQMNNKKSFKKIEQKFTYAKEKNAIYNAMDTRDEYDVNKLKEEFELEGFDLGEMLGANRRRFAESGANSEQEDEEDDPADLDLNAM